MKFYTLSKRKEKKKTLGHKLDMSKAYDRMEWEFIIKILKTLGFHEAFIRIVHECISSVSYSIPLNGLPSENLNPSRGLRQGDPLSPYLFIIGMEVLFQMFINAENISNIRRIKITKNTPNIFHLFFADDSFIFFNANEENVRKVKSILEDYCKMFGQIINFHKLALCLSKGTGKVTTNMITMMLGVRLMDKDEKYLENPLTLRRRKSISFDLVLKIKSKISSWKSSLLSQANRNILV